MHQRSRMSNAIPALRVHRARSRVFGRQKSAHQVLTGQQQKQTVTDVSVVLKVSSHYAKAHFVKHVYLINYCLILLRHVVEKLAAERKGRMHKMPYR